MELGSLRPAILAMIIGLLPCRNHLSKIPVSPRKKFNILVNIEQKKLRI
jgi:hypothetical protein